MTLPHPPLATASRVFVVDDTPSVRTSLQRLMRSVGLPCETFPSAREFLRSRPPDEGGCLILDVRMPRMSGLELQQALARENSEIPIIFLTGHADVAASVRAMKAGAVDYLIKPVNDQVLVDAVNRAMDIARTRQRRRAELADLQKRFDSLTDREKEVLVWVTTGLLNKQVAAQLGNREKTVKVHRAQVMHKMQADSFADLVRMSDKLGLAVPKP